MKITRTTAILLAAGCAASAFGQDSVSNTVSGLPGDAVSPFTSGQAYVVDLVPFTTRSNTQFGIAPIVKSSKIEASFFTGLVSSHSISRGLLTGVPSAAPSYSVWTTPGQGINTATNNPGSSIGGPAGSVQFGVALSEFSGAGNSIIGGLVNFDAANPGRLYVQRVSAATNRNNDFTGGNAALGYGAVDANGNVVFRADGNLQTGGNVILGNNIFRVSMPGRNNGIINEINGAGAFDGGASVHIVNNSAVSHSVPNLVPQDEGGPTYFGPNFNDQIVRGSAAGVTTSSGGHLGAGVANHRGSMAYSKVALLGTPGAVGSSAVLSVRAGFTTDTISVFDIDANGNPVGTPIAVTLPASMTLQDPCDPRSNPFSVFRFDHYGSQTAFQGGVSQVAIGKDQQGRILVAATVYGTELSGLTNPSQAIAVARLDSPTAAPVWSMAAWNDISTLGGKPIRDEFGTQIGRLGALFEVTGGSPLGPSMSAPAIDSVGNIWFVGVGVFDELAGPNPDNALFRAVYSGGTGAPCWTIESVVDTGNVFNGANSGTPWQLRFMEIADNNSVSSGTFYSQNVVQDGFAGGDVSALETSDPRTNGGVILSAGIIYDRNGDGQFDDPIAGGFPTGSVDEEYSVLLYIGNLTADADPCAPADYNNDGGVDILDLLDFLDDYSVCDGQPGPCGNFGDADVNGDGGVDILDFLDFFDLFSTCG